MSDALDLMKRSALKYAASEPLPLKESGAAFDELRVPLDTPATRERILKHSPAGKVPVLSVRASGTHGG